MSEAHGGTPPGLGTPEQWEELLSDAVAELAAQNSNYDETKESIAEVHRVAGEYGVSWDAATKACLRARAQFPGGVFSGAWLHEHGPDAVPGILAGGVFSGQTTALVVGEGGVGKTYLVMELAAAHARGGYFHHLSIAQGRVLFVSGEMSVEQMKVRLRDQFSLAELQKLGGRFKLWCKPGLDFFANPEESARRLCEKIEETQATLVPIDALIDVHSGEENSNTDMTKVMRALRDKVATPTKACLPIIHHAGKPGEFTRGANRARGASVLRDVPVDVLVVEATRGDGSGPRKVTFAKTRHKRIEPFHFELVRDEETGLVRMEFLQGETEGKEYGATKQILAVLAENLEPVVPPAELKARCMKRCQWSKTSYHRHLQASIEAGYVVGDKGGYRAADRKVGP